MGACYRAGVNSVVVEFRGQFRLMQSEGDRLRKRGSGTWYCRCGGLPHAEHANPRCEVCAGGGECGLDCTLSKLECPNCGATLQAD
jgi:hypothetical protein